MFLFVFKIKSRAIIFGIDIREFKISENDHIFCAVITAPKTQTSEKAILYASSPFSPHKNLAAVIPYAPHPSTEEAPNNIINADKIYNAVLPKQLLNAFKISKRPVSLP